MCWKKLKLRRKRMASADKYGLHINVGQNKITTIRAKVTDLDVNWIRCFAVWRDIEPTLGSGYDWDDMDELLDSWSGGKDFIVCIIGIGTDGKLYGTVSQYGDFIQTMVERYDGTGGHPKVEHYEVENEIYGLGTWWNYNLTDGKAQYKACLQKANSKIKGEDSSYKVFPAPIAFGAFDTEDPPVPLPQNLQDMLSFIDYVMGHADCKGYWDNFSIHSYWRWEKIGARIDWTRTRMNTNGVLTRPLWVTETGGPDNRNLEYGTKMDAVVIDDTEHELVKALEVYGRFKKAFEAGGSYPIERIFWHRLIKGTNNIFKWMSLLDSADAGKEAYTEFKNWMAANDA
jgi:hypothetical protein